MAYIIKNIKKRTETKFIAIHCSATGDNANIGAADIHRWHRAKGWAGIGYHFVIKRDGTVEEGREVEAIGAHVEGYNSVSVGICMVGGVDANDVTKAKNNFTDAQWENLKGLVQSLREKYPKAVIQGHRDFPNVKKACPSFSVKAWLQSNNIS